MNGDLACNSSVHFIIFADIQIKKHMIFFILNIFIIENFSFSLLISKFNENSFGAHVTPKIQYKFYIINSKNFILHGTNKAQMLKLFFSHSYNTLIF